MGVGLEEGIPMRIVQKLGSFVGGCDHLPNLGMAMERGYAPKDKKVRCKFNTRG
jgi:hypothetical protein